MPALSLMEALAAVPDPRDARGLQHPLTAILGLTVVAVLSGMRSLEAIAQFGRDHGKALAFAPGFRRAKTPVKSRLSTLFRRLDVAAVEAALGRWLASRHAAGWEVVTLDGKALRGSADGDVPGVHLLAAYAPQAAAVLGQVRVDAKTNEHKAALRLLGILPPLDGAVVTADAMFTHRDVCTAIRDRGGHYLLPAKDNQATLQADIRAALEDQAGVSPLPAAAAAWGAPDRDECGQGPRPGRAARAHEYDGPDGLPGLAGGRPGVPAGAVADGRRPADDRRGLRHHQPAAGAGGCRPPTRLGPRALGHREPAALRPG
jgi:DDE_Tnp_1-associated/Transposase DDE domain